MHLPIEKVDDRAIIPEYSHSLDSGFDLHAFLPDSPPVPLVAGEPRMIRTGIRIGIPPGYEIQVRSRSGLAADHGIAVLNSPGTVDAGYRGEIKVILGRFEYETDAYTPSVEHGDRIAQAVLTPVATPEIEEVEQLQDTTERGADGFGSTGT